MDEREFWTGMREALLGMAAAAADDNTRRSLIKMVTLIEQRYGIRKAHARPAVTPAPLTASQRRA